MQNAMLQDAITKCKRYWAAVENKVWTKTGTADVERAEFYKAKDIARKTMEKLSSDDAARAVFHALPEEHRINVRWNGDSTDFVANLVCVLLNGDAYAKFVRL